MVGLDIPIFTVAAVQEKYMKDDEDFDVTRNSDTK